VAGPAAVFGRREIVIMYISTRNWAAGQLDNSL
jgi:hypothetical protein